MDLGLKDRVYIVTGGARGLGRATAELLVAEGARVVLSGRNREQPRGRRGRPRRGRASAQVGDNADPETAGRLVDRGDRPVGPARRRPDLRRRPAHRHGDGHARRGLDQQLRVGVRRRPARRPAPSADATRGTGLDRVRAVQLGARADRRTWPSPTDCGRAWRWSPRPWPTSSARATSASTGCCPAASAPSGCAELDEPSGDAAGGSREGDRRRSRCGATDGPRSSPRAAAFLLSPGVILRHRRRCCPSTAACCGRSDRESFARRTRRCRSSSQTR